ncbi:MAG: hypothetical protein ABSH05_23705 [Bryobacteraceae bacterium]|jgi:hypothetical protein
MKSILTIATLAAAALATGCGVTLSLHPLYTDKELASDLQLEGKWTDDDAKDIWVVRKDGNVYVATCPTDTDSEAIEMRLVRLGDHHFLDLTSKNTPSLAIPGHLFAKVSVAGDELQIQTMGSKWLEQKARETGFPYLELDKQVILTAPTPDVQKFVLLHAGEPDAFEDAERLHRVR